MPHKDTIEEIVKEFEEKFVVTELAGDGEPLQINAERLIADYIDGRLLRAKDITDFLQKALQKSFHAGLQRAGEIVKSVPRLDVYDGGETEREDGDYVNYAALLSALTKEGESK